jgi:HK97 family phage major capsid protein
MDRFEISARKILAAAGAALPAQPLPAVEWNQLLEARNSLQRAATAIVDQAEAEGEALSGAAHDAVRLATETVAGIKREMDMRDERGDRSPRSTSGRLSSPNDLGGRLAPGRGAPPRFVGRCASYNALFGKPTGDSAFPSVGQMVVAAALNPLDPRFSRVHGSMTEGVGEDGGFAVSSQFYAELLDRSLEQEAIRPRTNVIPMASSMVTAPSFDYSDGTGAKRAGLQLVWMGEGAPASNQTAKLTPLNMRAHKAGIWIAVSNEAAEDIPVFERRIEVAMVDATTAGLDFAFLFGNGAGQPLGVMNAPALVTVGKEGSQTAATIVEDNLVKMAGRLHPSCWRNAVWLISPTCIPQLFKLAQATGPNAGARTAVISETDQGLRILGKEVIVTDACAPLGTTGDVILADLSKYLIGLRRDARLVTSIHAGWQTDETGVRMVLRLGGQPEWKAPVKLRDGTNTVSAFVALETRA